MATEKQIAANRGNALLSTGPKTAAGKAKSSMNSYRDGMRSKKRKLMLEESYIAERRKHKWMAQTDPRDDMGEFLMHQNVLASFELEHAVRVNSGRSDKLVENSDDKEIEAAKALGRRLFHDRCGPTGAYGNLPDCRTKHELKLKTSWSGKSNDPDDPAKLVAELEKTAQGCIWLRDEWERLRDQLQMNVFQSVDRFKACRLLGGQPTDVNDDRNIAIVFIAGDGVDADGKYALNDLLSDMRDTQQVKRLRRLLWKRWPELFKLETPAECSRLLQDLIDQQIERLQAMVDGFEANSDEIASEAVADSKVDQTPESYRLLNYIKSARRELRIGIAAFEKQQQGAEGSRWERTAKDQGRRCTDAAP